MSALLSLGVAFVGTVTFGWGALALDSATISGRPATNLVRFWLGLFAAAFGAAAAVFAWQLGAAL